MMMVHRKDRAAGISSEAVRKSTGKGWEEWFRLLDRAGAKKMSHKEIAAILRDRHGVGPWWQQMLTVGYEQARGLRQVHETTRGFVANASKTIASPLKEVFRAWTEETRRSKWMPAPGLALRSSSVNKSLRATPRAGHGDIEVRFSAKGEGRSQVTVQHSKLGSAAEVVRAKAYWSRALNALKEMLED